MVLIRFWGLKVKGQGHSGQWAKNLVSIISQKSVKRISPNFGHRCICVFLHINAELHVIMFVPMEARCLFCLQLLTGFPRLLESLEFFCKICRTWKVLQNDFGPGKSSNLLGCGCCDADAKIFTSAHLYFSWFILSDKTFFFATCDSDEHCSTDATVTLLYVEYQVSNCCLPLYLHVAGTTTGSWKILSGSWKSPGIYLGKTVGKLCWYNSWLVVKAMVVSMAVDFHLIEFHSDWDLYASFLAKS